MAKARKKPEKLRKHHSLKAGLPPGSPIYSGLEPAQPTQMSFWLYSPEDCQSRAVYSPGSGSDRVKAQEEESRPGDRQVRWIQVQGLADQKALLELGNQFQLHPLIMEDVLHIDQMPKVEITPEGYFLVTGIWAQSSWTQGSFHPRQISLVLKDRSLVSFTEGPEPLLDSLLDRIRQNRGIIRRQGPEYLLYALLDMIVDSYFGACDAMEEKLDQLEQELDKGTTSQVQGEIQQLRKVQSRLRRYLMGLRDCLQNLTRDLSQRYPELQPYLRDLQDHLYHILGLMENYRETLLSIQDLLLSTMSQRMNQVMKVLAVISTVFLPLTFLAGVYGMNFAHMPELQVPWAYPVLLASMVMIALGMLLVFRWKKWI